MCISKPIPRLEPKLELKFKICVYDTLNKSVYFTTPKILIAFDLVKKCDALFCFDLY